MNKIKVIAFKNLPTRLPIVQTVLVDLLLKQYPTSDFLKGFIYSALALIWIVFLIAFFNQEQVDIFKEKK